MQCPFCDSLNPQGARFCSACGAQLNLVPCPRCGAVNDAAALRCHQCDEGVSVSGSDAGRASASRLSSCDRRAEALERIAAAPPAGAPAILRSLAKLAPLRLAMVVLVLTAASAGSYLLLVGRHVSETSPDPEQDASSSATRPIRAARSSNGPVAAVPANPGSADPQGADRAARSAAAPTCTRGVAALGLCDGNRTPAGIPDAGTPRGRDAPRTAAGQH